MMDAVYVLTRLDMGRDPANDVGAADGLIVRVFLSHEGARRAMREEYDSMRMDSDIEYDCHDDEAFIVDGGDCEKLWNVKRVEVSP